MDDLINLATLWPGVRFCPTDEELVQSYLHRKLKGETFQHDVIPEVKLYDYSPEELLEMYNVPTASSDSCYFFTERVKKIATDPFYSRMAKGGFWEKTGRRQKITHQGKEIALKKEYYFITSTPGVRYNATKSEWIMAEYSQDNVDCEEIPSNMKDLVICHLSKKGWPKPSKQAHAAVQEVVDRQPIAVLGSGQLISATGPGQSSTVVGPDLQLPISVTGSGQSGVTVGLDSQLPIDVQESGLSNSLAGSSYFSELAEEENWGGVPNPGEYEGFEFDEFGTWFQGVYPNDLAPSVGTLPGTGATGNLEDESEGRSPVSKRAKTG